MPKSEILAIVLLVLLFIEGIIALVILPSWFKLLASFAFLFPIWVTIATIREKVKEN